MPQQKKPDLEFCNHECRLKHNWKHGTPVSCGCGGGHKMEPFGNQIVHWHGQHWLLECLVTYLLDRRDEDAKAIGLLRRRMQKHQGDIAIMACMWPGCDREVGKTYRMVGSMVICSHCSHDHGGESGH